MPILEMKESQSNIKSNKILVFIPIYNCENQIIRVLQQFQDNKIDSSLVHTILICNNHSTDNSQKNALLKLREIDTAINKIVILNKKNYGLGGSHKVAFKFAIDNGFTHVIVLHGDDQGSIENILPLIKNGDHLLYDCLLGARFHNKSILVGYSKLRTFGNRVFNFLFSLLTGEKLYDLGAGLNIYSTSILKDNFFFRFPDNLTFNYCMIIAHVFYKHNFFFFPISWREDDQISNVKLFSQAKSVLKMLLAYRINPRKFLKSEHRNIIHNEYIGDIVNVEDNTNEAV